MGGSYPAQNLRRNVSRRIFISPKDVGNKESPGAFNETLQTPKRQNGCEAREVTLSCVEIKETCEINYPKSKPHFSPRIRKKKTGVLRGYCGVQEFK